MSDANNIPEHKSSWLDKLYWFFGWLVYILGVLAICAGLFSLLQTIADRPQNKKIIVGQLSAAEQQQVAQVLEKTSNSNYFVADLSKVRDQVLTLSWVDSVSVSRYWPDGIKVHVIHRHPIAQWGSGRLLSDRGEVFIEADPQLHEELPVLHGPSRHSKLMMQQFHNINQWFAPLGIKLKSLHLTERMTWFLEFDSGLSIIVDNHQTQTKLQQLSQVAQGEMSAVWPRVATVDLRYNNGFAVQWKGGVVPATHQGHFVNTVPSI